MLFWPPPPSRVVVPTTPGVSEVSDAKLRPVPIGRFSTSAVVTRNERSPLCDWISGASDLTVTVSEVPPTDSVRAPTLMRSPPLTATPGRTDGREARHRDFDGVGVGRDVRDDEVAGRVGHHRRHPGAAGFADQRDGRARDREALVVLDRTGDGAGRDLSRGRTDGECAEHQGRNDRARVDTPLHVPLLTAMRRRTTRGRAGSTPGRHASDRTMVNGAHRVRLRGSSQSVCEVTSLDARTVTCFISACNLESRLKIARTSRTRAERWHCQVARCIYLWICGLLGGRLEASSHQGRAMPSQFLHAK